MTNSTHAVIPRDDTRAVWAVGDVHGMFALLERALDTAGFRHGRDLVVGVGDLIDRGPESAHALEWCESGAMVTVKGNHEWMMEQCLDPPQPRGRGVAPPALGRQRRAVVGKRRRERGRTGRLARVGKEPSDHHDGRDRGRARRRRPRPAGRADLGRNGPAGRIVRASARARNVEPHAVRRT